MKYIIKNCPVFNKKHQICNKKSKVVSCKDITDCVMKQIVENLKTYLQDNTCDNCNGIGYDTNCQDTSCGNYQCHQILELLEIEEVDE